MKKFIGVTSCLLALATTSVQANAEVNIPSPTPNWEFVGITPDGDSLAIQVMERQGQRVGYWQRIAFTAPQVGGYTAASIYSIGNCQQSTISVLWMVKFTDEGKLIANYKSNNTASSAVVVNSLGAMGLQSACRKS